MEKRIDAESAISLLYPPGAEASTVRGTWGQNAAEDLEIDRLAWTLSLQNDYQDTIRSILVELNRDVDTILYRQEVLEDFLNSEETATGLQGLLTGLAKLRDFGATRSQRTPMQETLSHISELSLYTTCVRSLEEVLRKNQEAYQSRGLKALKEWVETTTADETYQELEKELPGLLAKLTGVPSVSVGINLDNQLRPVEATILEIHDKPFKGGRFLDKVMGRMKSTKPNQGISRLHAVPFEKVDGLNNMLVRLPTRVDPLMVPLFRDLYELLRWLIAPINAVLKQFDRLNISLLISLETEIAFYLGAAGLIRQMRGAGLPMCRAEILPVEARSCRLTEMYNLFLALHTVEEKPGEALGVRIVRNEADFGPEGRIFILTGPNLGGKTVYTQAIGVVQALFQAGLYVPAAQAAISPVDGIHTHFARLEKSDSGMGRLGEEAVRLNEIFQTATEKSLVLLNESLASTSPGESLYLARDIVCALRLFGVRAVFATHLHELAEDIDKINAETEGDSQVVSLVSGVDESSGEAADEMARRTYVIQPGPPRGLSFARGIASKYGISYDQLAGKKRERKIREE